MKYIELQYDDMVAIVDDEDFELVKDRVWYAVRRGYVWYAQTWNNGKPIYLHKMILQTEHEVDHKNRDGLDNRRTNLRSATRSQQSWNQGVRINNRTGYKGVHKVGRRYRAQIKCEDKRISIGYFDTPEDAAREYDRFAKILHGEFASTNF